MSTNNITNNEELIKSIDLVMKSNHNTNSDIISLDDMPKKEIISEKGTSDPYTEIKFTNQNSNNEEDNTDTNNIIIIHKELKENLEIKDNQKDVFGDLTSIIKNKIKTRNMQENNKNKKVRLLSASSAISTTEKNKKMNINLSLTSRTNLSTSKNNNKIKKTSSIQKNKNSKILKKTKKNPEIFVNKTKSGIKNNNTTAKKETSRKVNFNDVLKRFDEEKQTAKKRFENKKKEIKEQENKINTGKPKINKKGKNYNKFSKDFLTRQKELNDKTNVKKKKLIEEDNKKKEKEYKKIITDSILTKKMKQYKKNKSTDEWVERLYKEDPKKRKMERDVMQTAYLPTFHPYIPKRKINKSVDKINKIDTVLNKYNENQNPQLLIDYFNKNKNSSKFDDSENLFRQKIFYKNGNNNKKRSNSLDINISDDNNEEYNEESD